MGGVVGLADIGALDSTGESERPRTGDGAGAQWRGRYWEALTMSDPRALSLPVVRP